LGLIRYLPVLLHSPQNLKPILRSGGHFKELTSHIPSVQISVIIKELFITLNPTVWHQ
jgi:hypothetical protein